MLIAILGVLATIKPGRSPQVATPLFDIREKPVSVLTLDNGEHMRFERKEGGWELVEPFHARVNQIRLEQLLSIPMLTPAREYPLADAAELKNYGLASPFATLGIDGHVFQFGDVTPLDRRRYVRFEDRLCLLDDGFSHQLASKATDFVDKKLIPDQFVLQGISIPGFRVSRKAEGGGWISSPTLEQDHLQDLIMQWSTARAIEVRMGAPKVLGETIEVETAMGPIRFSILQKTPELILGRNDQNLIYVMTSESSRLLLNPAAEKKEMRPEGHETDGDHEEHEHEHDLDGE